MFLSVMEVTRKTQDIKTDGRIS